MDNNVKNLTGVIILMLISLGASAVRVGVVVEFPDGTVKTECVEVAPETDGYKVMQETSLVMAWSDGGMWGHGLCGIESVGCPANDCYCNSNEYWSFHFSDGGGWDYMPVGWDAGDSCWDGDLTSFDGHYCAREGDLLGYAFGPWGSIPGDVEFSEVCPIVERPKKERNLVFSGGKAPIPGKMMSISTNDFMEFNVFDEKTGKIIEDVTVEVRNENLKWLKTIEADENGTLRINLDEVGEYRLLIMARGYPHKQATVLVTVEQTTTSSSTTSITLNVSSSSSSTTTVLSHFLAEEKLKTTTTSMTGDTTTTITQTTTIKKLGKVTGNVVASGSRNRSGMLYVLVGAGLVLGAVVYGKK